MIYQGNHIIGFSHKKPNKAARIVNLEQTQKLSLLFMKTEAVTFFW